MKNLFLFPQKLKTMVLLIVYLLINSLFVLKYGIRQPYLSNYLLLVVYILVVLLGIKWIDSKKNRLNNFLKFNNYFIVFSTIIFIFFILINLYIDGGSLHTDRWSALEVSIKSVLNFEYPYDKFDHMQGTSSNFPGLIYLGIPFYWIGDVGFLQVFIFLGIIVTLFYKKIDAHKKTLFLFLLLMSPAYLWEIFAKSDLMSNLFLVVVFMVIWDAKFKEGYYRKPLLLGIIAGFLLLTRAVVAIPLTFFLFGSFIKVSLHTKIKFVVAFLGTIVILSLPILLSLPDAEIVRNHNPINNQTMHSPLWIMMTTVTIPFLLAIQIKTLQQILFASFAFLSLMLFYLFFNNAIEEGFDRNLYDTLFDISYLGMILPFLLFSMILEKSKI